MTRYVSTAQVARALGLSVTTVKRWVDDEVLPAQRTAGGHRKILLGDVLRLVHQNNLPHGDLTLLQDEQPAAHDLPELSNRLLDALNEADGSRVRSILIGAYEAGLSLAELGDHIVSPAMTQIGCGWETGRLDVYQEHTASRLCLEALLEIKRRLEGQLDSRGPLAIGGAPENDHSLLASLLVEMTLLTEGWQAINFSAHTPSASFIKAMDQYRPTLLWLSVTHLPDVDWFLREYRVLFGAATQRGVKVVIGGQALTDGIRSRMLYTMFGDGLTQLVEFTRTLHPPARTPKRGRPAKK